MFTLSIKTDNEAFNDPDADLDNADAQGVTRRLELARILREVARYLDAGSDSHMLYDANGNNIGYYATEEV